jgi:hypothetical protein
MEENNSANPDSNQGETNWFLVIGAALLFLIVIVGAIAGMRGGGNDSPPDDTGNAAEKSSASSYHYNSLMNRKYIDIMILRKRERIWIGEESRAFTVPAGDKFVEFFSSSVLDINLRVHPEDSIEIRGNTYGGKLKVYPVAMDKRPLGYMSGPDLASWQVRSLNRKTTEVSFMIYNYLE